jgi:hypothetical protein
VPKISETLVAYAQPLLLEISGTASAWRAVLYLVAIIWNGVLMGVPESEIVAVLRQGFDTSADVPGLVRSLFERKQSLFADDPRLILDVQTQQRGDHVYVHVTCLTR